MNDRLNIGGIPALFDTYMALLSSSPYQQMYTLNTAEKVIDIIVSTPPTNASLCSVPY